MRVLFLGTPQFAVPSLTKLLEDPEIDVVGVITQPDRPAGRGKRPTPPPVKEVALAAGLPIFQPERIRGNPEARRILEELQPDVAVVVAFGQILPVEFFEAPPHGTVNVHASLLPRYRGAAPVVHALLNGESKTGVTIMRIDEGMDTGDMLAWREVPIPPEMTAGELEALLAREGAALLIPTLHDYVAGRIRPVPQDPAQATYAPRIKKEDAVIDWTRDAARVHNLVRAMNPKPGAVTSFRGTPVKIWRTLPPAEVIGEEGKPGEILARVGDGLKVACGRGAVIVTELQLPGRRRITGAEFANGFRPAAGERFS
ncbi:MAG: methionyl-tRNA formyltransferase [Acidobacteriota bacterium]